MILHGIYDRGKIKIKGKKLPDITSKVEIYLREEQDMQDISKLPACGMWKDREEISDPAEYVRTLRKKTSRRSYQNS